MLVTPNFAVSQKMTLTLEHYNFNAYPLILLREYDIKWRFVLTSPN